ncbi:hypothetical protein GALL_510690 [mine drainage metagenome]|uniref:Uncharacterized protein n=1 Tax=mine drainage metagenome TaxID=410659 RepID=A0A1J5P9C5_9ZZZZ
MGLNGPRLINDHGGDTGVTGGDEVLEKTTQIEPGTRHPELVRAIANDDVEPDLGDL